MTHVHFIGIGGSGLSAIARYLMESGYTVTGSDRVLSPFAEDLQSAGVQIYLGRHARNLEGVDWIVRSSAVAEDNPEVIAANSAGIPIYTRGDIFDKLIGEKDAIAVAGTHGKTTTTGMIAFVLTELRRDPSFIVGSVMMNYGLNARVGKGNLFVIEADEYDRMFLGLRPRIEVVTNLEHDHPDYYPTYEGMFEAFESFVSLLPTDGTLIACIEDPGAAALISRARRLGRHVIAYSLQGELTLNAPQWVQARNVTPNDRGGSDFEATTNVGMLESFRVRLQLPGEHNVRNALATLAVVAVLGLPLKKAAAALGKYSGTSRRFEIKGEKKGIVVIDDYAHHPTEIKATLSAARSRYPGRRVWAVWQPHTYSRTRTLQLEFTRAFSDADEVIVTDVYAAREPKQDFSAAEIVSAMPHSSAHFIPTLEGASAYLLEHLERNDVLIVLSAGDANQISADVLAGLNA